MHPEASSPTQARTHPIHPLPFSSPLPADTQQMHLLPPPSMRTATQQMHSNAPVQIVPGALQSDRDIEINEIRLSHADLCRRVSQLSDELRHAQQQIYSQISIGHRMCDSHNLKSLRKAILFANIRAVKALQAGSSELLRRRNFLCRANSVMQVVLRSQPADCTLHEFQLLAMEFSKRPSLQCSVFPSEYYALFANIHKASRFSIVFDSYMDICHALEIDIQNREAAVYRERCTMARDLQAVQVIGVDCIQGNSRRVLVGYSMPKLSSLCQIPVLYQENSSWSEGTWESGFSFRSERIDAFFTSTELDGQQSNRTSDIDRDGLENQAFCLSWERIESTGVAIGSAEQVPGFLRSFFPAVVLRTRLLTSSTKSIFSTKVDGKYIKQIVVSPRNPSSC